MFSRGGTNGLTVTAVRADLPWVGVAVVAIGGLIELLQGAMGLGRDAEWLDLVADALGVALGLILVLTPLDLTILAIMN